MIINPVIIVGAPRSGTSLLFHILRTTQPLWSLPSEGFHIWNNISHPSLYNWSSEECPDVGELLSTQKQLILKLYNEQIMPNWFWNRIGYEKIWKFSKTRAQKIERKMQGELFINLTKILFYMNPMSNLYGKRLVDKTVSNCLRLDIVKQIFPEARYIYIKRNGIDTIKSLIHGWLNPDRFVTFSPQEALHINGYNGKDWKFVMPEGWREFGGRHISELCSWQWQKCHEKILEFRERNASLFLDIKLEELVATPADVLKSVADFSELPYENFSAYTTKLPVVNEDPGNMKDVFPFPEYLQKIKEDISPLMKRLGYD